MNGWTDTLYARPSILEGIARALDLGGTLQNYNYGDSNKDADLKALRSDWNAVGDDLMAAMKQWLAEQPNTNLGESLRQYMHDLDVQAA